MSIRDRQITNAEAKAMQSELQAGRYPELTTIQRMIADIFMQKTPGLPQFTLTDMANTSVSDPEVINIMLRAMGIDVGTGFDEVVNLENQMMGMADYYETEKNKVNKSIKRIAHRIESVVEQMQHRTQSNVITKHFHDFIGVEFLGDNSRNLPQTTVLVDLLKSIATLDKTKQGAARYDITGASVDVRVSDAPISTVTQGDITNILKDAVNASWRYVVTTKTTKPVTVTLIVKLAAPIAITTLGFLPESPAVTEVTMYVSQDNVTYVKQETKSLSGMGTWSIPLTTAQYIKLELKKTEPDATRGTSNEFAFGASRIFLQRDLYQTEGKLVSAAIPVGVRVVDQVQINPVESKLPGTNIRYYAAIDDGIGHMEWVEADQDRIVQYNAYQTLTIPFVDLDSTVGFGAPIEPPQFGNQNYTLINLPVTPQTGSTKLYVGEQMWQVDHYTAVPATPPASTGPSDWNVTKYTTDYYDLKKTFSGNQMGLLPGYNRMTMEFQIDSDQMPFVQRLQVDAGSTVAVYLNNTLLGGVKQSDGWDYTYKFTTGVNKIVIYTYGGAGFIAPNLDLMLKASWARASSKPLTEVSLYNLYSNTSVKDKSKFAWKDRALVVNYNPGNIRYALSCKYTTQNAKDTSIRFMAIFTRAASATDTSAQLNQYQLVVK